MSVNTVLPSGSHTHTIIFLHGRDSNADEFAAELFESQATDDRTLPEIFPSIKWVFPTSKPRRSARFDADMTQWFDMWSVEEPEERGELQIEGLRKSVHAIWQIIKSEAAIISMDRIILAGISQGCATAVHVLLAGDVKLGGFIGLCGWLPFRTEIEADVDGQTARTAILQAIEEGVSCGVEDRTENFSKTPVFLGHCDDDSVVPVANGERLCESLWSLKMDCTWRSYQDGGHWMNEPAGVDDIVSFIRERIL